VGERKKWIRPPWLVEFRKRTAIIDIIDRAFSVNCGCDVCMRIREIADELGELFMPRRAPATGRGS